MNTYLIPLRNEETFIKKVSKYVRKANSEIKVIPTDNISLVEYRVDVYSEGQYVQRKLKVKCREYQVEGTYKLNDWIFVGTIEHKENGNVIRCIDEKYSKDATRLYLNAPCRCEHCNTIRYRKDTFIVYNEKTNEYKQVGKNCLKDYTGFSAETCAAIAECLVLADQFTEMERISNYNDTYLDTEIIKDVAYSYIKKNGYNKDEAKRNVCDLYFDIISKHSYKKHNAQEYLNKVSEWIKSVAEKQPYNEYYQSCNVIWNSDNIEYRDINYMLSMLNIYFKEENNRARKDNVYVGEIGDKVEFTVSKSRMLVDKSRRAYDFYLVELVDTNGNTYIWSTSNSKFKEGTKIQATVKGHSEYKGIKQTVITRGKVLETPKGDAEELDLPKNRREEDFYWCYFD